MASLQKYKLSQELVEEDCEEARALDVGLDFIVSGHTDASVIVWKLQEGKYVRDTKIENHHSLSAVCVINPTEAHPKGLIVTGSHDDPRILVYMLGETEPLYKIDDAHKDGIRCIRRSNVRGDAFLSSSKDKTAKLWCLSDLDKPQEFSGHTSDVNCVEDLKNYTVVTGSADKSVIVHARDGKVMFRLTEHADAVNDIAVINDYEFLTCSDDAVIKFWSASTGQCLSNFFGHSNHINSLSTALGGSLTVSCGEDRTIRVWINAEVSQTISIPAENVWSVKLLPNQDIACATPDGKVRIFTTDKDRFADARTLMEFDEAVVKADKEFVQDLKNVSDINALYQPGMRDGETKLVKEGPNVKAYSWSQRDMQWKLVGDVAGASGSKKAMHNGVEYDHVFCVDVGDGLPPYKLPYNKDQDPWHVAQRFIDEHSLRQSYLESVANFIIKNTTKVPVIKTTTELYDSASGSYIHAGGRDAERDAKKSKSQDNCIPLKDYWKIEKCDLEGVRRKLEEFNKVEQEGKTNVTDEQLNNVVKLPTGYFKEALEGGAIDTLTKLLDWPDEYLFPVLDIVRLSVGMKNVYEEICKQELVDRVLRHLDATATKANQMLTYRLLANMFYYRAGRKLVMKRKAEITASILPKVCSEQLGQAVQIAMATYLLNLALASAEKCELEERMQDLRTICEVEPYFTDEEARYRVLVGLGTLLDMASDAERAEMVQIVLQFENILKLFETWSPTYDDSNKMDKVRGEIYKLIGSNI